MAHAVADGERKIMNKLAVLVIVEPCEATRFDLQPEEFAGLLKRQMHEALKLHSHGLIPEVHAYAATWPRRLGKGQNGITAGLHILINPEL